MMHDRIVAKHRSKPRSTRPRPMIMETKGKSTSLETRSQSDLAVNTYPKVKVLGEPTLKKIARELVTSVKKNVTIDWTVRENVRAQLRVQVKRILRKYGYPPDKQEKATETVLEQAAVLSAEWAAA